jgi:serine O-acetyltransferase
MSLLELLYADLERQDFYAGVQGAKTVPRLFVKAFSPRFAPVVLYRLSHHFYRNKLGWAAKLFSMLNFWCFGIEIAMRCEIGPGLYLPHTVGTVISARSIGARATIFQQVTLGAKEVDFAFTDERRPELGDDVLVGTGAKVLGGLKIGHRAKIGANAVVVKDIPDDAVAVGVPAVIRRVNS